MGNVQHKRKTFHIWIVKNIHLRTQCALQGVASFGFGGITCVTQTMLQKQVVMHLIIVDIKVVLCHNSSVRVPILMFIDSKR
jgi:hypothetical protein